jgi:formate hydrogenlyase transcriptional activator
MSAAPEMQLEQPLEARYEALIRVSQAISAQRDCKDFFRALAVELRHVVRFDYINVSLYDETASRMCCHIMELGDPARTVPFPPDMEPELSRWTYDQQEALIISDVNEEVRFSRTVGFLKSYDIRSTCTLPLTTAHRRIGCLGFGSKHPGAYSQEEMRFLSLVADQVALAIDDAVNFEASQAARATLQQKQEELQRERDRLKLLLEVNNSVVAHLELRDLLRAISANVRKFMQLDAVGVVLPDRDGGQLRIYALDFPSSKGLLTEEISIPMEGSVSGAVFRSGKPMQAGPPYPPEMSGLYQRLIVAEGIRSLWLLPLFGRHGALGVLGVGRLQENAFSQEEIDSLSQVSSQVAFALDNALAYCQINDLKDKLAQEKLYLEDEIRSEMNFDEIIGKSAALRRALKQVETVAPTGSTVLIYGETGTGKELIARAVHNLSPRKPNPFVKLNCAAIPTGLLESELFGHEKGAFTGAITQRIGRFELANRGTVFLDEIGEIPLELQPKLLRVLQEREFERLGSSRTLRTDARLIAATNRDLTSMVDEQKFRSDLFYRLNVFPVHVPPLRERPEDIPLLVRHFSEQLARRMNKIIETIPSETMEALCDYHWPGNIRELQNVIERAVILSSGPMLKVSASDLRARSASATNGNGESVGSTERRDMRSLLEETERKQILNVLEETNWVVAGPNGAAARLGMKRSTLQLRMQKLGLSRNRRT